jgi:hypothetical protein
MKEPQQQTLLDDGATLVVRGEETTLVAPRFDDEETLVARPVVPLGAAAPAAPEPPRRDAHDYRRPYAPRRTWTLGLVLVSVLIGGVLGGAGLYLYQRQSQDPAVSPAAATRPAAHADAAPAEAQQAAPDAEPSPRQTEPSPAAPNAEETAPPASDEEAPAAREPESVPAADRRTAPAEGTPKRGKKGERDEELERRASPRPDGNVARTDDSIFDRPRRVTRRARANDDLDRLRRIFEGTP